jgi:hypothetical protein
LDLAANELTAAEELSFMMFEHSVP